MTQTAPGHLSAIALGVGRLQKWLIADEIQLISRRLIDGGVVVVVEGQPTKDDSGERWGIFPPEEPWQGVLARMGIT